MSRFSTCLAIIGQLELAFKVTSTSYGALIKNVTFETLLINIHYRIHPILSILVLRYILNQDWLLCFNGVHNKHRFIVLPHRKKLPTLNFSSGDEQCLALRPFRLQTFFVLIFFPTWAFRFLCIFVALFASASDHHLSELNRWPHLPLRVSLRALRYTLRIGSCLYSVPSALNWRSILRKKL